MEGDESTGSSTPPASPSPVLTQADAGAVVEPTTTATATAFCMPAGFSIGPGRRRNEVAFKFERDDLATANCRRPKEAEADECEGFEEACEVLEDAQDGDARKRARADAQESAGDGEGAAAAGGGRTNEYLSAKTIATVVRMVTSYANFKKLATQHECEARHVAEKGLDKEVNERSHKHQIKCAVHANKLGGQVFDKLVVLLNRLLNTPSL
jgi:hypothetical protein